MGKKVLATAIAAGLLLTAGAAWSAEDAAAPAPITERTPHLTVVKRVVCKKPTRETIACTFRFIVTNNGPGTYTGPLVFSDALSPSAMHFGVYTRAPVVPCAPVSPDATASLVCSVPTVTIPFLGTYVLTVTANVTGYSPAREGKECVTLTRPLQSPVSIDCKPF